MVKPYLNQVGGKVDNDVSQFIGGLNAYQDKAFLDANEMPYVMNMQMYKPPMMSTRPSRVTWAGEFNDVAELNNYRVVSAFANAEDDIFLIVRKRNGDYLQRYYKTGLGNTHFTKQEICQMRLHGIDFDNVTEYYFAYCPIGEHRYLYIGNEHCKMRIDINGTPGNPLVPDYYIDHFGIPVWHKGRLWLARPSDNTIEWSNALEPDNFTVGYTQDPPVAGDSGEVYVNDRKGSLVNIVSYDDKLMVFCEHSVHAIYGNSGIATDANYFQVVDVMNNLGLIHPRCVTAGGGRLFWVGDDHEVYEYTGASFYMVSRPATTRNQTIAHGGISGLIEASDVLKTRSADFGLSRSTMIATSEKLYLNIWNRRRTNYQKLLFVFDLYNRTWWCEDGDFDTIANYSDINNQILLIKSNGDVLISQENGMRRGIEANTGKDKIYDYEAQEVIEKPIKYEFHTRVYGADGTDLRESISSVWFQARAEATVYLNDIWTSLDEWSLPDVLASNLVEIGKLESELQKPLQPTQYRPDTYEQQVCYVEKMYGQRLNTFQIIVKGRGYARFYLMKREWRAR